MPRSPTRALVAAATVAISSPFQPYLLSIDSADVSFAALARRVDRVLDSLGVTSARVVAHAHGGGETQRAYADPMLREIGRVVSLALRLADAREPDSLPTLIAPVRVPVTVILGDTPRPAGPGPQELISLEPLGTLLRVERLHGVGHFPHEEAPAEVASVLLGARSQVVAGPAGSAR